MTPISAKFSGLQSKLKDCARLMADAQQQVESNAKDVLVNIMGISTSAREAQAGAIDRPSEPPPYQPNVQ